MEFLLIMMLESKGEEAKMSLLFMNDDISKKSSPNLKLNDRFGKLIQKCPWIFELIFIQFYEAFILFFHLSRSVIEFRI